MTTICFGFTLNIDVMVDTIGFRCVTCLSARFPFARVQYSIACSWALGDPAYGRIQQIKAALSKRMVALSPVLITSFCSTSCNDDPTCTSVPLRFPTRPSLSFDVVRLRP